jgi:phosphatidate cytidylyltransferase
MLKQRIITAAILIPLFLFMLFQLPLIGFSLLTGLLVFWAATEWSRLMGVKTYWRRFIFPVLVSFVLIGAYFLPVSFYILYMALVWWVCALFLILFYPKLSSVWGRSITLRGIMGLLVLVPCWLAINYVRYAGNGAYILLYLFLIIWGADIGAYFVGRKWGRHKMAPVVSPGKSWEGLLGALIVTIILVTPVVYWYHMSYIHLMAAFILSILTVLFSVVGDLFESMLKRNVGLKDSGNVLPGHGGILDRIDSLTAAAPIFVLGLIWMNKLYYTVN